MTRAPIAIFLTGPIGVGKTTLGRALAELAGSDHVEGDSYQLADRPWYAASRRVAHGILRDVRASLDGGRRTVISYPLRCREWVFFRGHLVAAGYQAVFVCLRAPAAAITADDRGRVFSAWEVSRIGDMIAQGYDRRPFCDLHVPTHGAAVPDTLGRLAEGLRAAGWID